MALPKLIVVFGATGKQGGSVVDSFLNDPGWQIRGITRNKSSEEARALAACDVDVAEADLDNPSTLPPVTRNANAIFAVTNFWDSFFDPATPSRLKSGQDVGEYARDYELQQFKNVIDAAAQVTSLERLVISAASDVTKWSRGKYTHSRHFDSKAWAVEYCETQHPKLWAKTSVFMAGFFLDNFAGDPVFRPVKSEHGVVHFMSAVKCNTKLPMIAPAEDTGPIVRALIEETFRKKVIGYRGWINFDELIQAFTHATGLKAQYYELPLGGFAMPDKVPPDMHRELTDMIGYCNEFGYEGRDDPTVVHPSDLEYPPKLQSVEDFFKKQNWDQILT